MTRAIHAIAIILALSPLDAALGWQTLALWLLSVALAACIWELAGDVRAWLDGLEAEGL